MWRDAKQDEARQSFALFVETSHFVLCDADASDLISASIQFEYDPDQLATKITTQLIHKSNSETFV